MGYYGLQVRKTSWSVVGCAFLLTSLAAGHEVFTPRVLVAAQANSSPAAIRNSVLVCRSDGELNVDPFSLTSRTFENRDLYRFAQGSLYLSSPTREEYRYNDVVEANYLRWTSGYKTIVWQDETFRTGVSVHIEPEGDARVLPLNCNGL